METTPQKPETGWLMQTCEDYRHRSLLTMGLPNNHVCDLHRPFNLHFTKVNVRKVPAKPKKKESENVYRMPNIKPPRDAHFLSAANWIHSCPNPRNLNTGFFPFHVY